MEELGAFSSEKRQDCTLKFDWYILSETNSSPLQIGHPKKETTIPSIFRCKLAVSFREGIVWPYASHEVSSLNHDFLENFEARGTCFIFRNPRLPNTCSEGVLGCFRYVFGVQIPSHKVFGSLGKDLSGEIRKRIGDPRPNEGHSWLNNAKFTRWFWSIFVLFPHLELLSECAIVLTKPSIKARETIFKTCSTSQIWKEQFRNHRYANNLPEVNQTKTSKKWTNRFIAQTLWIIFLRPSSTFQGI